MLMLGFDPGINGALAVLAPSGALDVAAYPLSARKVGKKTRNEIDAAALAATLRDRIGRGHAVAFVEQVQSQPTDGAIQAFAFGTAYGVLRGVLAALHIPVTLVTPQVWKKALAVPADKGLAVKRASEIFPAHAGLFRGPRGGALDGPAEAALIAYYGRQQEQAGMRSLLG